MIVIPPILCSCKLDLLIVSVKSSYIAMTKTPSHIYRDLAFCSIRSELIVAGNIPGDSSLPPLFLFSVNYTPKLHTAHYSPTVTHCSIQLY